MRARLPLERLLNVLAGALAALVMVVPPAAFLAWSYRDRSAALESEAHLLSVAVTDYVNRSAGM